MYSFETVPISSINENEFYSFENKSIFTTIPWIRFIEEDNSAVPVVIKIFEDDFCLGYFSGLLKSKYGIKILGSPFRGWSTCFMGFDLNDPSKIEKVLPELIIYIFDNVKCHYFECVERSLSPANTLNFTLKTRAVETLELDIDRSDDELFHVFKGDCRNFIRQFERRGATIEVAEPNDDFAEEYYDQLKDVFAKQGLVPTYSLDKVKKLLKHIGNTGMVLCLRVREPNGKSIATSIFLGFKGKCFFWGGASYREYQNYRPNEYMIWNAIKYWRDHGAKIFDMVGVRGYKLKFGSEKKEYINIFAAKYSFLISFRDFAEKIFFGLLKIKGFLSRVE
jgi:hypothetical protein